MLTMAEIWLLADGNTICKAYTIQKLNTISVAAIKIHVLRLAADADIRLTSLH